MVDEEKGLGLNCSAVSPLKKGRRKKGRRIERQMGVDTNYEDT
jgi:hypothetical protein